MRDDISSQTENSLNTGKESRYVESFEKDLSCYIPILPRVQWSLSQQYRVLLNQPPLLNTQIPNLD
jgi:hypothetical protein